MKTFFASTERNTNEEILSQNQEIFSSSLITILSNASNTLFLILNQNRQIIFANNELPRCKQTRYQVDNFKLITQQAAGN